MNKVCTVYYGGLGPEKDDHPHVSMEGQLGVVRAIIKPRLKSLDTDALDQAVWAMQYIQNEVWSYHAAHVLEGLPYQDFLQTSYWKAVSRHIKKLAGFSCQICCSTEKLSTHHRSYRHHGWEHSEVGLADLVCLCDSCHKTHHKIDPPQPILSGT